MEGASKTYETRQKRRSSETVPRSRVDWKRTKVDTISYVLDETTTSEEEEESERDDSTSISSEESEEQKVEVSGRPADDGEEDHIKKPRRKSKSATIGSSDSSSDSDGPGTKVNSRPCRAIDEDDEAKDNNGAGGVGSSEDEEAKAQIKKQKRKDALKQMAARRRSRNQTIGSESEEESLGSESTPLTPETLDEEEDSQEMADFIDKDDEEDEDGNRLTYRDMFLKHNIDQFASDDLYSHLQKVINAFLINIVDNKFLESLYDGSRNKRYAKDMLKSLNYLDQRVIAPRLEKLTTSCRWSSQYKERVNSYPQLLLRVIDAEKQSCEACKLKRFCKYLVTLSGGAYDSDTLEKDDFLPDDKQMLVVGRTCANRTEVYHRIRHYKYHLYRRCTPFLHETKDDSAKEIVEIALSKMEEKTFIKKEVEHLERLVEGADYFQEELAESLLS